MKTAVINIKIDAKTKKSAQKIAESLGLNLSAVVNGFLRTFVRNKRVVFDINPSEEPTGYMLEALRESEKESAGSPVFDNAKDAVAWLKDKKRRYAD